MNTNLRTRSERRAARGFTLIELLIVLAVTSVMLGTALPSFTNFIRTTKLTTATNDLLSAIVLARSEAIKRKTRVALCKSQDGTSCAPAGGWDQGWIVFQDTNNNGVRDAGEQVLSNAQPIARDLRVLGNLNVARYISYSPTGESKLAGGGFQAGTITLCTLSSTSENAREIVISSSGRPRAQRTQVASCA